MYVHMEFVIGKQILNFRLKWQSVLFLLSLSTYLFTGLSAKLPEKLELFFENHCMDCHDDEITEGGLDFLSLTWQPEDSYNESIWVKIHDRIKSKEMPPPKKSKVQDFEREELTQALGKMILEAKESAYVQNGRSVSRRINRFEYENVLRDLLHDPYLKIAGQLPLDGESMVLLKWALPWMYPMFRLMPISMWRNLL